MYLMNKKLNSMLRVNYFEVNISHMTAHLGVQWSSNVNTVKFTMFNDRTRIWLQ